MIFAAGAVGAAAAAAGTALDLLSSLGPSKSGAGRTAGIKQPGSIFDLSGSSATTQGSKASAGTAPSGTLAPSTFNALLSAQDASQPGSITPPDPLKDLFAQIDCNADGEITKAEFQDKLGAGGTNVQAADNVFSKMDADGDGVVSFNEMAASLRGRHHPSSTIATNASVNASSQYNVVDQMVQRQTDALATAAKQSLSITV